MHLLAMGVACAVFAAICLLHRRNRLLNNSIRQIQRFLPPLPEFTQRPSSWLAVRSARPETVRTVLPDRDEFFVSPRPNGWVIVTGPGLPCPSEDVDACFRFLTGISRRLGHLQFFYAEKFSRHHAWARIDDGYVTRAYAWAGETIWNQGRKTTAEMRLRMRCFDYGDNSELDFDAANESASSNLEKIPLLAARWSVDPARANISATHRD